MELPSNGDFLPPQFWYFATIALGFILVGLMGILGRWFLDRFFALLKHQSENIAELTKNVAIHEHRHESTEYRLEKLEEGKYNRKK